jgi:hypothetical protein
MMCPENEFEGVKDWPSFEPPPAHHNQPPLEDQVLLDFDEAVRRNGLDERLCAIMDSAERAPKEITTADDAGSVGDLIALAKAAKQAVEDEREILNRPLLTAQRGLKGKADSLTGPMEKVIAPLRTALDAYVAAEDETVVHGDLGARVGTHTVWEFEVFALGRLPLDIRRHPTVLEAIDKVVRARIKAGARKITGVKIWATQKSTVR